MKNRKNKFINIEISKQNDILLIKRLSKLTKTSMKELVSQMVHNYLDQAAAKINQQWDKQ